ncbi:hypothetical protein PG984_002996 [Apiospora sp. TS-2023a]
MSAPDYTKYRTTPGVAAPSGTRSSTSSTSNGAPAPTNDYRLPGDATAGEDALCVKLSPAQGPASPPSAPSHIHKNTNPNTGAPSSTNVPPSGGESALGVKLWAQWGSTLKFKTSTVPARTTSAPGHTSTSSNIKSGDPAPTPTCALPSGEKNAQGVQLWAQWGSTLGLWGVLAPWLLLELWEFFKRQFLRGEATRDWASVHRVFDEEDFEKAEKADKRASKVHQNRAAATREEIALAVLKQTASIIIKSSGPSTTSIEASRR